MKTVTMVVVIAGVGSGGGGGGGGGGEHPFIYASVSLQVIRRNFLISSKRAARPVFILLGLITQTVN
jgi:hypothetical protein